MKIRTILFSVCMSMAFFLLLINLAEAGTATIYGKVTEEDGTTPASATKVTIRVWGVAPSADDYVVDFPWVTRKATTDAGGNYKTLVLFPDNVKEIAFYAEVIKANSLPFKRGHKTMSFIERPPENNGNYQLNIKLSSCSSCIIVQGRVEDIETGLALSPLAVGAPFRAYGQEYYSYIYTDSEGFYRKLISLDIFSAPIKVVAPTSGSEVKYITQQRSITTPRAGRIYTFNFKLKRDEQAAYVFGTITDLRTGKPIPFAKVCVQNPPGSYYCGSNTDFLGRYKRAINTAGTCIVSTTGAHTTDEYNSPYYSQTKNIVVGEGEAKSLDFELIPK